MAYEKPLLMHSRIAAADLSAKQYYFVKLDSSGNVDVCSGATDRPYGVLQNAPTSGQAAEVMLAGISKVSSDGTIAVGALIGTSGDGQADSKTAGTDTTEYVVGQHIGTAAAAAGDTITCTINCLNPHRGA